jgi:hypothetical protein
MLLIMTAWVTTSACITSAADESEKALEAKLHCLAGGLLHQRSNGLWRRYCVEANAFGSMRVR